MKPKTKANQLNAALATCDQVTSLSPNPAYICGGAPRDIFLGRTPKDYDIFVPVTPDQVEATAERILRWIGGFRGLIRNYSGEGQRDSYGYMREEVLGVLKSKDGSIDVVFVDAKFGVSPEGIVSKFDNSLSMAWITPDGQVHHTAMFDYSVENKVLIAIPCNQQSDTHLKRVAEKFPDFTLVA